MSTDVQSRGPKASKRRSMMRALLGAKVAVSAVLIVVLLRWIDIDRVLASYRNANLGWLVAGLLIHQTQTALSALKWRIILKADGEYAPYGFLWRTYLIGNFLSLFLPTSFGGDVYRVWALQQDGLLIRKSTASVLFDRLSGIIALLGIGTVGAYFVLPGTQSVLIATGFLVLVASLILTTSEPVWRRLPQPKSKYLGFPFRIMESFRFYRQAPRKLLAIALLSLVFQLNVVMIVLCYTRAVTVPAEQISAQELVAAVPVIYLTELLPIAINGIGVRDGAFAFFFERLGGTAAQGLAVSFLIIVVRYSLGLVGGVLLLSTAIRGRATRCEPPPPAPMGSSGADPVSPSPTGITNNLPTDR